MILFYILASLKIINVHAINESPLRHNLRPDDVPVQGPKHFVLVIYILHHLISCVFDSTHFINVCHHGITTYKLKNANANFTA
jgi:hypothetical protein